MSKENRKEMKKLILIAAAFSFIFIFILNAQSVMAVTLSACGTLSSGNTTYVLDRDISTNKTCLNVTADNVTIDCQSHRINFGLNSSSYGVYSKSHNFVTVKNCMIVGNDTSFNPFRIYDHAIYLISSSYCRIFNNTLDVRHANSYGIYLSTNSNSNNMTNNTIINQGFINNYGIFISTNSNSNNVDNNNITSSWGYGVYLLSNSNSNNLRSNIIKAGDYGIFLSSCIGNDLKNNNVTTSMSNSYAVYGSASVYYSNSIDASNLADGKQVNYTYNKNNLVFNNVDFTKYGQVIFAWGRNITITNSNFSRDSLNLFYTSNSNISNNRIKTSTGHGIWLYESSNNNTISNNMINTSVGYGNGLYLYHSSGNDNMNNNISTYYGYGIYLDSNSDNNIIYKNIVTTYLSNAYGIYLNGAKNIDLDYNKITTDDVYSHGIRTISVSNSNVTNNVVTVTGPGSSTHGLYSSTISNFSIANNTITVLGSNNRGMFIEWTSGSSIFNNTVKTYQDNSAGIYLTTNSVRNNISYNNVNTLGGNSPGIYLYSGTGAGNNRVYNNKIRTSGNTGHGIEIYRYSNSNNIYSNLINTSGATAHGVYLEGGPNNATGNNITTAGDSGYGIYIYSLTAYPSPKNILKNNIVMTNGTGSYVVYGSASSHYNQSIDFSNLAEGKPVNYTYNKNGLVFNNVNFTKYGQVIFAWCQGIKINNSNFSSDSLNLFYTSNSRISNNRMNTSKGYGIWLYQGSNNNNISNNKINTSGPYGTGIYLYSVSGNNAVNNTVSVSGLSSPGIILHSSANYNRIRNNTVKTARANGYGIRLSTSSNGNNITNISIKTLGDTADGIYFLGSSNANTISNVMINTSGTTSRGIYLYPGQNNIFKRVTIRTYGSNAHGVHLSSTSTGNVFRGIDIRTVQLNVRSMIVSITGTSTLTVNDSIFEGLATPQELSIQSGPGTWNFTNVTRRDNTPIRVAWALPLTTQRLNIFWYLDVSVSNSTSPLAGALVSSYNKKSALAFSGSTSAQGKVKKAVLEYSRNNNTNYTWYSPYNLTISLPGYSIYYNSSINMSNNKPINLNLACFCPRGQNWNVRDHCSFSGLKCNMPDNVISCSDSGEMKIASNSRVTAKRFVTPINHTCIVADKTSKFAVKK